jgi:hypothetical protein
MEAEKPSSFIKKRYVPKSITGFMGQIHDFSFLSGVDIHLLQIQIYY